MRRQSFALCGKPRQYRLSFRAAQHRQSPSLYIYEYEYIWDSDKAVCSPRVWPSFAYNILYTIQSHHKETQKLYTLCRKVSMELSLM